MTDLPPQETPIYVIADADEGVQLNVGTRLGIAGAGIKVTDAAEVFKALKKLLGVELHIVASDQNDWVKHQFGLANWEETSATMQQQIESVADDNGLLYAGNLTFTDPRQLKFGVKGHMVRPKGVHIAMKIAFTLGGGEQTYNLGQYLISAEWITEVDKKIAKRILEEQVAFYEKVAGRELDHLIEEEGPLDDAHKQKAKKLLLEFGLISE